MLGAVIISAEPILFLLESDPNSRCLIEDILFYSKGCKEGNEFVLEQKETDKNKLF